MFEFLFKRANDPAAAPQEGMAVADASAAASSNSRRDEQAERARALAGDEAGAVELILSSEFAGVRLAAAEHVQSQPMLEKVLQAMRNTDRRVAKLMQGRLDAIRYRQAEAAKAQGCIDAANKLLQDEKLTPNQVAELDRQWAVTAAEVDLSALFAAARAALAARLEAQVNLQRKIIDALAALRQLPEAGMAADAAASRLAQLSAELTGFAVAPEHAALPRHLLSDFAVALEQARAALAKSSVKSANPAAGVDSAALQGARAAANAGAGAGADSSADNRADSSADAGAALAETAADGMDAGGASDAGADAAGGVAVASVSGGAGLQSAGKPGKAAKPPKAPKEVDKQFLDTLDAMEAALEQGLLHAAADHDKWLKEHKSGRLTPALTERLAHLRSELKRLGDWARWGGNVSREELIKTVEDLSAAGLAMSELAKKVGSMRERWKALDAVSGHAPKSLWERFDSACTTAYAPAAAHFKQLANERHSNAIKAQALIDETLAMAGGNGAELKNIAAAGQRLRQMWTRLGTIDRKDKRKLDQAFDKALAQLLAPLSEQRKLEAARREELIAAVEQLQPSDRHSLDKLRQLQERWQQQARALPLDRKDEQALWLRFRAACDIVFTKRKEVAHAADHERKAHLHAREAICVGLETATFSGDDKAQLAAISKTLRDAANRWHAAGAVPRASEQKINQRYQDALHAVQAQADGIKRRAGAAQANALRDKLRLCQALEAAIVAAESVDGADWEDRWKAVPALGAEYERTLHGRLAAAVAAAADEGKRSAYARQLEENRARLLAEVLRLEIVSGVDSGAEFARERLKMQVEVLQSSLKSGQKPLTQAAQFLQLCGMPALADARTASRIEQLFRRIGATEKA